MNVANGRPPPKSAAGTKPNWNFPAASSCPFSHNTVDRSISTSPIKGGWTARYAGLNPHSITNGADGTNPSNVICTGCDASVSPEGSVDAATVSGGRSGPPNVTGP